MMPATTEPVALRPPVRCQCGAVIFDGQLVRARVIKLHGQQALAKCKCKRWLPVPLQYRPLA